LEQGLEEERGDVCDSEDARGRDGLRARGRGVRSGRGGGGGGRGEREGGGLEDGHFVGGDGGIVGMWDDGSGGGLLILWDLGKAGDGRLGHRGTYTVQNGGVAYRFPRRFRNPVMVLCAFLTSWCFAWLPMYCE
jgi:hypothetical protein